ncbi:hypothetical protein L6232_25300, partial [Shewanella sp. C31]|nr:hypothetical protein [Shewanella electrica]
VVAVLFAVDALADGAASVKDMIYNYTRYKIDRESVWKSKMKKRSGDYVSSLKLIIYMLILTGCHEYEHIWIDYVYAKALPLPLLR